MPQRTPTVVVVDDSSSVRLFFDRVVENLDVELQVFESAAESLAFLEGNKPDLLFLDS